MRSIVPGPTATGDDIGAPLLPPEPLSEPKSVRLGYVSGLISTDRVLAFERLLFRATRGNMYLK
jgi:V-type H+-transporting ATPase subunit a